jgi:hypothetical protein
MHARSLLLRPMPAGLPGEGGGSQVRVPRIATRSVMVLVVPMLAGGLAAAAAAPSAAAASAQPPARLTWVPYGGEFLGVAATSARSAWAVGWTSGAALIERWNGKRWKAVPGLLKLAPEGEFVGVAATSARNAWAVGYEGRTLIAHWNGRTWKRVPSPHPGSDSILNGVAAISARDAWAVGDSSSGALIEHWNGTAWKVTPSPNPFNGQLFGVAATSAHNAWAVGNSNSGPLIEHWNGTAWKVVPSPDPGTEGSTLAAVSVTSAHNAWAVGSTSNGVDGDTTLILRWNGSVWTQVASPNGSLEINGLTGVAATSARNAWAVGSDGGDAMSKTMILHWNGSVWKRVSSPNPFCATCDDLNGVAATSAGNAWAVGTLNLGGEVVLLHWNGRAWRNFKSAPEPL